MTAAGAAMLGFHPRTRRQGYGGRADWAAIRELSEGSTLPIVGSGDLDSAEAVLSMLETTGCAGAMIARGGVGNPWIYTECRTLSQDNSTTTSPSPVCRLATAARHLQRAVDEYGEETATGLMKKSLAGYVTGWPDAAGMRRRLMQAPDAESLFRILGEMTPRSERAY